MATIKDIAAKANVSVATVSRVLNKRGYLSEKTIAAVHKAMKDMDYHPNDLARSLHNQRSNILGIIVPSLAHPFFGEVTTHIECYAYQMGFKILASNSLDNKEKEREYITMLRRSQVDGIIVGSHTQGLEEYENINLPLISLDRKISANIPYVCCDNYAGGEMATKHLIENGCKKILHICGNLSVDMLSNMRTKAFVDVCETSNVEYKVCERTDTAITNMTYAGDIPAIVKQNPDCDGIFTTSDVSAAIAIRALYSMGRRVPEDVKVVGFDGVDISFLMNPQITTIQQPMEAIGRYAVDGLLRQINGDPVPSQMILPVTLIQRASTQCH